MNKKNTFKHINLINNKTLKNKKDSALIQSKLFKNTF